MKSTVNHIEPLRQGPLENKLDLNKKDEWGTIETAFNEMTTGLLMSYSALEESEARFRDLAKLFPQIVFETDQNGNITFCNEATYLLTGYSKEDLRKNQKR